MDGRLAVMGTCVFPHRVGYDLNSAHGSSLPALVTAGSLPMEKVVPLQAGFALQPERRKWLLSHRARACEACWLLPASGTFPVCLRGESRCQSD